MKKYFAIVAVALCASVSSPKASAGNPLDAIGGLVSSFTSTSNFDLADIVGTWSYQSPAISFKSDDVLGKIGGAAAGSTIENKLATYYNAAGLNTLVLTVNSDYSFTMKIKSISLTGTVSKVNDSGELTFNFNAMGKVSIGKVSAMAEKSATNNLTLTFDASRVISIAEKIGSIANISSLNTIVSLLKNYDGLYAGARLKKTASAPASDSSSSTTDSGASNAAGALKSLFGK